MLCTPSRSILNIQWIYDSVLIVQNNNQLYYKGSHGLNLPGTGLIQGFCFLVTGPLCPLCPLFLKAHQNCIIGSKIMVTLLGGVDIS